MKEMSFHHEVVVGGIGGTGGNSFLKSMFL